MTQQQPDDATGKTPLCITVLTSTASWQFQDDMNLSLLAILMLINPFMKVVLVQWFLKVENQTFSLI